MTGNAPGNDMRFSYEKVEASRNFANKVWNASRFILMNMEGKDLDETAKDRMEPADRWILSKLNRLIKDVTDNMEHYELGIAVQKVYDFVWDEFCDWYIEMDTFAFRLGATFICVRTLRIPLTASFIVSMPFSSFAKSQINKVLKKTQFP